MGVTEGDERDLVEVTRCRDCRWARDAVSADEWHFVCALRPLMQHYTHRDDFCSKGERRQP